MNMKIKSFVLANAFMMTLLLGGYSISAMNNNSNNNEQAEKGRKKKKKGKSKNIIIKGVKKIAKSTKSVFIKQEDDSSDSSDEDDNSNVIIGPIYVGPGSKKLSYAQLIKKQKKNYYNNNKNNNNNNVDFLDEDEDVFDSNLVIKDLIDQNDFFGVNEEMAKQKLEFDKLTFDKYTLHALVYAVNKNNVSLADLIITLNSKMVNNIISKPLGVVDGKNYFKETVLHLAVRNGNMAMVSMLLNWGADVNAISMKNQTPLALAKNEEVKHLLIEHGGAKVEYAPTLDTFHGAQVFNIVNVTINNIIVPGVNNNNNDALGENIIEDIGGVDGHYSDNDQFSDYEDDHQ